MLANVMTKWEREKGKGMNEMNECINEAPKHNGEKRGLELEHESEQASKNPFARENV